MAPPEKFLNELPPLYKWKPIPIGDWIDMEFVLQAVEVEQRGEVLAAHLETMANIHRTIAEGAAKMAHAVRGKQGQR
jgi:hypothetical protein